MKQIKWIAGMLLLVLLCWPAAAWAVVDAPEDVYVGDYANVLRDETEQYIIAKNQALAQATGAQIVVVTVDFLDGMTAENYAYKIFNDWGIGDQEKNNGLLLLLAIGDDDYWAMQGKGLEGVLSSGTLGDYLYDYLEPDFAAGNYDDGVQKVFDAFLSWFTDYYQLSSLETAAGAQNQGSGISNGNGAVQTSSTQNDDGGGLFGVIVLVIIIIVAISLHNRRKDRKRKKNNRNGGNGSSGGGGFREPQYGRPTVVPRAPRGGVFIPPRSPQSSSPKRPSSSGSVGNLLGGGSSRGGGAGRSSGGFGGFGGSSGGFGGGFGGGGSRGGGAGRR